MEYAAVLDCRMTRLFCPRFGMKSLTRQSKSKSNFAVSPLICLITMDMFH